MRGASFTRAVKESPKINAYQSVVNFDLLIGLPWFYMSIWLDMSNYPYELKNSVVQVNSSRQEYYKWGTSTCLFTFLFVGKVEV